MTEPVRQRALAIGAGLVVGTGVGLGMTTVVPEWQLVALTVAFWGIGVGLFGLGYQRLDLNVDPAAERAWWKVTTQRGWVGMVAVITVGLGVFYWLFARFAISVPVAFEIWFTVSMPSLGPMVAGIGSLLGVERESPFVDADEGAT